MKTNQAFVALGSNVGDRVGMIEAALRAMETRKIKVIRASSLWETKPMYVVNQEDFINGVCEVNCPKLDLVLVETSLEPVELLKCLKDIESSMGRRKARVNGPREIDLDILLYNEQVVEAPQLKIPHLSMLEREFVLRPLCELIPERSLPLPSAQINFTSHLRALSPSDPPLSTITILSQRLPLLRSLDRNRATRLMAIMNITPDSFSDGGEYQKNDMESFTKRISELVSAGASVIDIGGQSTRPGAEDVGEAEELSRVVPAIRATRAVIPEHACCISIDTYRAKVAEEAVKAGADLVNDVSGGTLDPMMLPTVARLGCSICLMHMRGSPTTMKQHANYPKGVIAEVGAELLDRVRAAEEAGIRRWRIVLDPGIGFAKDRAHNLELLRRLPELRSMEGLAGLPWLVGTSRKAFIGHITGVRDPKERVWGTAATVTAAVAGGADLIRVHDVAEMSKVVKMADAIWRF